MILLGNRLSQMKVTLIITRWIVVVWTKLMISIYIDYTNHTFKRKIVGELLVIWNAYPNSRGKILFRGFRCINSASIFTNRNLFHGETHQYMYRWTKATVYSHEIALFLLKESFSKTGFVL